MGKLACIKISLVISKFVYFCIDNFRNRSYFINELLKIGIKGKNSLRVQMKPISVQALCVKIIVVKKITVHTFTARFKSPVYL